MMYQGRCLRVNSFDYASSLVWTLQDQRTLARYYLLFSNLSSYHLLYCTILAITVPCTLAAFASSVSIWSSKTKPGTARTMTSPNTVVRSGV